MFFQEWSRWLSPVMSTSGGAGVERLHHAGQQVGGARAERRIAHPHPAAHLGVGVGGEHAAALVVH